MAKPLKPYDPRTKTGTHGVEIAKAQAKDELRKMNAEYLKRISEVCAKVLVVGGTPENQKAAKLVAQEQEAVVVSAASLYDELYEAVKPFMVGRQQQLTLRAIHELERQIGSVYSRYAPRSHWPRVPMQFIDSAVNDIDGFIPIVQATMENTQGKPILPAIASVIALREAVRLSYDEEPVAIVVTGIRRQDLPAFETSFFPGRPAVVIDLDKVKNVEGAFKSAADKLAKAMGLIEEKPKPKAEKNEPKTEAKTEESTDGK